MPSQTLERLSAEFGMPGVLTFLERGDLVCAEIRTPAAQAVIALQGAHVMEWQPAGEQPVLFLSERSAFAAGKAVRGGVPVIWPWFGPRTDAVQPAPKEAPPSAAHGFARTALWTLSFAALAGEALHLTFLLGPSADTKALGFDGFRLAYEVVVGRELLLRLSVANDGNSDLCFEEALHSYFAVGAVEQATLHGLEEVEYLDKRDGGARKREGEQPLRLSAATDRVYFGAGALGAGAVGAGAVGAGAACRIDDGATGRQILLGTVNSQATVVWNPWTELTAGLPDMAPEGWRGMLCVETANVGDAAIRLAPGKLHTMELRVRVGQNPLAHGSISA